MTREQARDIINKFVKEHIQLDNNADSTYENLHKINPILAKVYQTYMAKHFDPRWFYEEAENALIIGNSKLGKALG